MPKFGDVLVTASWPPGSTPIRSGPRAPVAGDGALGEFWLDTANRVLYGPKGAVTKGVAPEITNPSNDPASSYRFSSHFTAVTSITIAGMRGWRPASEPASHTYLMCSPQLGEMARITASGETQGWVTAMLNAPVTVAAGTQVSVSVLTRYYGYVSSTTSQIPSLVTMNGHSYVQGGALTCPPWSFTAGTHYGLDLLVQEVGWPLALTSAPVP